MPFDHRGSFELKMFGWHEPLTAAQTAEIAAAKQVIYDGFRAAIDGGVPKEKAGILVDEQFGAAILRDASANGFTTACPAEKERAGRVRVSVRGGLRRAYRGVQPGLLQGSGALQP